jgi:hypothetical protein
MRLQEAEDFRTCSAASTPDLVMSGQDQEI